MEPYTLLQALSQLNLIKGITRMTVSGILKE
jgi:hypothetical protein